MALAFLSSIFIILALPPYDLWPLAWFSLVPLLLALPGTTPREAAWIGAFSGTATNYMAFYWILELMDRFSKLGPAAYLVMLAMAVYQCLPWAFWCWLLRSTGPAKPGPLWTLAGLLLSATAFVAVEFFFPIVFPWYLANTQHTSPATNSVIELAGVSLLSLAILVVNMSLARLIMGHVEEERSTLWPVALRGRSSRLFLAPLMVTLVALPAFHFACRGRVEKALASSPKLALGLVQPNEWIGQGPSIQGLHDYQRLTQQLVQQCQQKGESLDLVLWPESAVRTPPGYIQRQLSSDSAPIVEAIPKLPRYPLDVSCIIPDVSEPAASLEAEGPIGPNNLAIQRGHDVPVLFGTTMEDIGPKAQGPIPGRPALYNCAVLIDKTGKVHGVVKKVKLLMFGETIPGSSYFPQVYNVLTSASALLPGQQAEVITFGEARLGIMICYEDLLPWFHYQLAQKKPQILLNLTNDAWFGKTAEPYCHLSLATLRAVEGRCYLVRSTPTGMSAVIDPYARLVASIASDKQATLRHEVALLDITTGFERWGDTVAWFSLLFLLGFGSLWWRAGRRGSI